MWWIEDTWPNTLKAWIVWSPNPLKSHFLYEIYFITIVQKKSKNNLKILYSCKFLKPTQKIDPKSCTLFLRLRFAWNSDPSRKSFSESWEWHSQQTTILVQLSVLIQIHLVAFKGWSNTRMKCKTVEKNPILWVAFYIKTQKRTKSGLTWTKSKCVAICSSSIKTGIFFIILLFIYYLSRLWLFLLLFASIPVIKKYEPPLTSFQGLFFLIVGKSPGNEVEHPLSVVYQRCAIPSLLRPTTLNTLWHSIKNVIILKIILFF